MQREGKSEWAQEGGETRPHVFGVSELSRELERALKSLGRLAVEGEVSQIKRAGSGHVYFGLKDLDALISCAIWKSRVPTALRFALEEGMRVVCHGELDVYKPRGTYTLIVERVEARGAGDLLARFETLKRELAAKGWFERKRPLPTMPRLVGLVTSRDGAALRDFLRTRSLRWPLYPVLLAHSSVQGALAAQEIADAIRRLDQRGVGVIVLARGGGSLEDLWCFNELLVAEAIRAARVPVVSGIGHETDFTLADFVADHRAHTPTAAAQTVIPDRAALVGALERAGGYLAAAMDALFEAREQRVGELGRARVLARADWIFDERERRLVEHAARLRLLLAGKSARAASKLAGLSARLARLDPRVAFSARERQVGLLALRLASARARHTEGIAARLELAGARLAAISPLAVLARGYSLTRRARDQAVLLDAREVVPGEAIETWLSAGVVHARVERTSPGAPTQLAGDESTEEGRSSA